MDNTTACTDSATCPCNDNGICQCDEGYTGDKCNQCLVGYFDNNGNATNTPNCTGKLKRFFQLVSSLCSCKVAHDSYMISEDE